MHAPYERHLGASENAALSVSPFMQVCIVTHVVQPAMRTHTPAKVTAMTLSKMRATKAVRPISVCCAQHI
jgi:hypothetical protein